MTKKYCLLIISILILFASCFLGIDIYNSYNSYKNNSVKTFPFSTYDISLTNFILSGSVIEENLIFLLYKNNDYYLLKEINTLNNQENIYSYSTSYNCTLQNQNDYPFISCVSNSDIKIYDTKFKLILNENAKKQNDYITYNNKIFNFSSDTELPISITCFDSCYAIKYNELDNLISLYRNNELLETNILNYQQYENGYLTYKSNKINIYNAKNNEYKEFLSPINSLNKMLINIGNNNYYLYVLNDKIVQVYNLYNGKNFINIDISKVSGNIAQMLINNGNLYLFTAENLYIYDISEIENNNSNNEIDYEDNLINNKVKYFQENYNVDIKVFENPAYLSTNHQITPINNYNQIIEALETMEDYFLLYNKDFFQRYFEYGMDGLDFYFASEIIGLKDGFDQTDVVGVYLKKNNKYIIILNISGVEDLSKIASHETMHAIEDYLKNKGETFENWNSYNPQNFDYSHTYYINEFFSDTLNNNKNNQNIYFIDNYARSSAAEDRARLFEYICRGESLDNYPHLNDKTNYLKDVLLKHFPELYYIDYFNK